MQAASASVQATFRRLRDNFHIDPIKSRASGRYARRGADSLRRRLVLGIHILGIHILGIYILRLFVVGIYILEFRRDLDRIRRLLL
jgi:hypothetical protein